MTFLEFLKGYNLTYSDFEKLSDDEKKELNKAYRLITITH